MREDIERFVASLAIPDDRKAVVLAELLDHAACAGEGARAALGDLEALRRSLEAVGSAFRTTRKEALLRGVIAGVLVALVLDQGGPLMFGVLGAALMIALAVTCAPSRFLDLLRAELRAPRIRGTVRGVRGRPIGPAIIYAYTVTSVPFLVWIGLIVQRGFAGVTKVEVPWSAFAVMWAMLLLLAIEAVRARRSAMV